MHTNITVECPILETTRVQQVRGMFDLAADAVSRLEWNVNLPLYERAWNIGLIVGPSGCGKTTIARQLFPQAPGRVFEPCGSREDWTKLDNLAVVDAFPETMPIKDIVALLSSVGFSSPPGWLRPIGVLSTGQQFRVRLALLLAGAAPGRPIAFDEYTSVVDRTVAQIGSAALARTVRQRHLQFVAVTCHEDVENWLGPDWVYRPAENVFAWRRLRCRPRAPLDIVRCSPRAWALFAPHPDYQGVGIGNALSNLIASLWVGLGYRAISTTTHPAMIRSRLQSRNWQMHRRPSFAQGRERLNHAVTRLTAGFVYVGPPMPRPMAQVLLER
jgi:ABC-type lipoprotein export system ATPase subunit